MKNRLTKKPEVSCSGDVMGSSYGLGKDFGFFILGVWSVIQMDEAVKRYGIFSGVPAEPFHIFLNPGLYGYKLFEFYVGLFLFYRSIVLWNL
jgi:hypothetical protein